MEGPNQIVNAKHYTTWQANGYYQIRESDGESDPIKPISLVTAIRDICESPDASDLIAFKIKRDDGWRSCSYTEYYRDIKCLSRAFIKLGLEPRHAVAISGFNSPEWFLSEMACIFTGGVVITIIHKLLSLNFSNQNYIL